MRLGTLSLGFLLGAAIFIGASIVIAWTGPTSAPPNGNVSAPINMGDKYQEKQGVLGALGILNTGSLTLFGANRYLAFNSTADATGYGIRDNAGTLELKSSGGVWRSVFASTGGLAVPDNTTVTTCNIMSEGTQRYNSTSKQMEFCNGTAWTAFGGSGGSTSFNISSDTQNANLYVIAGSPATAGTYTITINAGVTVGSASAASASLSTGVWPTGSTVKLINNGNIYGKGGDGGGGGSTSCSGSFLSGGFCTSSGPWAGGAGGAAISLSYNLTIDNTNGKIFGGGGGGGGGRTTAGGGGGGGQGVINSSGGSAGTYSGSGGSGSASAGSAGTVSGPGSGGDRGTWDGGPGGTGGAWGSAGGAGGGGAAGGAAGKAILLNGKTITWLGGNDATHVKGAVQ